MSGLTKPGGLLGLSLRAGAAVLALAFGSQFASAEAQAAPGYSPGRTSWGVPDLQGTWSNASITDLQRSPAYSNLVLTPEEAARIEGADYYNNRTREDAKPNDPTDTRLLDGTDLLSGGGYNAFWVDQGTKVGRVKGELRSSWIVEPANGRIPYKAGAGRGGEPAAAPAAQPSSPVPRPSASAPGKIAVQGPGAVDRNAGGGIGSYDNPETRPMGERCLIGFGNTGGPVMTNVLYNNTYQIVQAPEHVMILVEMVHDARIIPITRDRMRPDAIKPWLGDSIGWYEGDTLVVETRNVHPLQRGYISASGVLTERFTRWSKDHIVYAFTVDDPSLYSQPWKGEIGLNLSPEPLYEYACHEGNYAMEGILGGARKQEREGKTVAANADEEGR
ncbi:MAG: hypothetical protein SGJ21_10685 [Alphaproteobacteria bacterium]|nr:hypothetical protein [Alphaproteobacteria bacterium]